MSSCHLCVCVCVCVVGVLLGVQVCVWTVKSSITGWGPLITCGFWSHFVLRHHRLYYYLIVVCKNISDHYVPQNKLLLMLFISVKPGQFSFKAVV